MPLLPDTLNKYNKNIFIETGSYFGEGIQFALDCHYTEIHSIEINFDLYHNLRNKFVNIPQVHLYHGDSTTLLPKILSTIDKTFTCWLDAHPDGELSLKSCPLISELEAIKKWMEKNNMVPAVLCDDMRLFPNEDIKTLLQYCHNMEAFTVNRIDSPVLPRDILELT